MTHTLTLLADDLAFGEAPRWHNGALYLSDMHANRVLRYSESTGWEVVAEHDGPVSGLGWLPDGDMLVVSMHDRRILRHRNGVFDVHADLSGIATWHANDMIVAPDGTAYVGNFGFDIDTHPISPCTASIARVTADGTVSTAAAGLWFPNGMVIQPDGVTMIVAESGTRVLTELTIAADGALVEPRLWARLPDDALPDGICLDAAGCVWAASPTSREVLCLRRGGEVVDRIATEQEAIACVFGGEDRRTLFILTADSRTPAIARDVRTARVYAVRMDVAGAGLP
ncbi:sugar lactone lactonase YvrE [Novosphingobium capsulatum]|uniref:Sugar lactone lactonase YvrE n=1 Tax=Novosphingobium capsulatum TaxID=13688 RepID=A0ABU1MM16_9SPHN|nr:SMP-30/gluconolactonase/LRE family protein [Novosphingobium capsulatum]MDR6510967.1 sugar lactone lactonase YvrE [Novosphingobium capsulatum]